MSGDGFGTPEELADRYLAYRGGARTRPGLKQELVEAFGFLRQHLWGERFNWFSFVDCMDLARPIAVDTLGEGTRLVAYRAERPEDPRGPVKAFGLFYAPPGTSHLDVGIPTERRRMARYITVAPTPVLVSTAAGISLNLRQRLAKFRHDGVRVEPTYAAGGATQYIVPEASRCLQLQYVSWMRSA